MIKFSKAIQLITLIFDESLRKAEAIICLEGDGYARLPQTAKLFKEKWGKFVVISGGVNQPPFSIPAYKLKPALVKMGVPVKKIILEEKSENTYQQGREVMKIVKKKEWQRIILVASAFHQLRAFLTFLKAMEDMRIKVQVFNYPARDLSWFEKTSLGLTRFELLKEELQKIKRYRSLGHLVSLGKGIEYQKWKEKQG